MSLKVDQSLRLTALEAAVRLSPGGLLNVNHRPAEKVVADAKIYEAFLRTGEVPAQTGSGKAPKPEHQRAPRQMKP